MALGILRRLLSARATKKSRVELHSYWKQPWDGANPPEAYLNGVERSRLLIELLEQHSSPNPTVLELGCNVGRNLEALRTAGYTKLSGVEISANALALMKRSYPELAAT